MDIHDPEHAVPPDANPSDGAEPATAAAPEALPHPDHPPLLVGLLWWAAGAEARLLMHESCWLERARYAASGAAVITTTLLAGLSAAVVLYHFVSGGSLAVSVLGGVAWGAIILNLDRLLLLTLVKRDKDGSLPFWVSAPRIGLAALAAIAISVPAELVLFRGQLDVQVRIDQEAQLGAHRQHLAARYSEIPQLEASRRELVAGVREADQAVQAAYKASACEADGTCGSGKVGASVLHAQEVRHFEDLSAAADRTRRQNETAIKELDRKLKVLEAARESDMDAFRGATTGSDDLLGRLMALKHLEKDPVHGAVVASAGWVIRLLSLCLELLPLFLKLTAPRGPYDAAHQAVQDGEAAHWGAAREKALERADVVIVQERLLSMALKETSGELIAAAAAQAGTSPMARRAQRELAQKIVERSVDVARDAAARVFDDRSLREDITSAAQAHRRRADRRVVAAEGRRANVFRGLDAALRRARGLGGTNTPLH